MCPNNKSGSARGRQGADTFHDQASDGAHAYRTEAQEEKRAAPEKARRSVCHAHYHYACRQRNGNHYRKKASLSGIYNEITLGQYTRLIVDGAEVTFKHITLERLGTRVIELVNGAQLHVGALGFASMGASIVYRIGAGCALTFDASQWDPEVVANTTFDFASQGSGSLKYFPFINPEWLDCPNVTGYSEGDLLEIAGQGSAQRFQVRDGRIVANRPR